jgi:hypothetical protein
MGDDGNPRVEDLAQPPRIEVRGPDLPEEAFAAERLQVSGDLDVASDPVVPPVELDQIEGLKAQTSEARSGTCFV